MNTGTRVEPPQAVLDLNEIERYNIVTLEQ
jgi:hypothetical protein